MKSVRVHYYSLFREQSGQASEDVQTAAATPAELFAELSARYGFSVPRERLRVALDDEFVDWSTPLTSGATVVFIPPVAGG